MGTRRSGRIPADERSVVSTIRGIPAWTAVLLAVAITLSGVAIDSLSGGLGAGFIVAFFLGCLIAALAVARHSVFVAGIQPPIIMAILVPLAYVIADVGGGAELFSRTQIISVALPLATRFPVMVTTTIVVVAVALIRAFVLEPRSSRRAPGVARG
ncbi:MAG TPA: hypothetical protein H9759_03030 [Candidatus Dietzia intestinipullorum]|nr:hypothetical protein [Candidatus Dietzia intestinipullorum]